MVNSFGCTPDMRQRFLDVLRGGVSTKQAAKAAGIGLSTLYRHRAQDDAFAAAWREADIEGMSVFFVALRTGAELPSRRRAVNSAVARARFLEALRGGASGLQAAAAIGVDPDTPYRWRAADPVFAAQWQKAREAGARQLLDEIGRLDEVKPPPDRRRRSMKSAEAKARCLDTLSGGGSVRFSARSVGVNQATVVRWRHEDPEFAAAWAVAYRAGSLALLEMAKRRWLREKVAEKRALGLLPPLETAAPRRP